MGLMVPLHKEIAQALVEGFGGGDLTDHGSYTTVTIDGHEPIEVFDNDVILPTSLECCAAGVRLDVQAVLAGRH